MLNDRLLRRTWIGSAIGTIATSIAALRFTWGDPASGGSASAFQPSLGLSLYGMKTLPLDVAMKACAEIGYSHVEFAMNVGYPTEPAVFSTDSRVKAAAMLKELRLSLPCLMLHMSLTSDDKAHASALALIQSASELGRDLMPEQPPILETVLGGSPTKWEEQKKGM